MNLFGLMITKDDQEIFAEWCEDQLSLYDAVVCLDGSTTDETARIARQHPGRLIYLHERAYTIPQKTDHGLRRIVHQEIVHRFGTDNWVMCCHTDEFCYHDPRKIAALAARGGYDGVAWYSLHFCPHPNDLADWSERRLLPLQERVRYYHWNFGGDSFPWCEDRLYRNGPAVAWDRVTHGCVRPHGLGFLAPFHPILRHYKVFTTDLAWYTDAGSCSWYRHHWEGLEHRTGLPFSVNEPLDLFVPSFPGYSSCDRFEGTFPQSWNIGEDFRPTEKGH